MKRHYTIEEVIRKVDLIRSRFENPCISTDIIVGFKGETDEEFSNTLENLKKIKFDFMHIFPYSERAGTVAMKLKGAVDKKVMKDRENILQELNHQFKSNFYKRNIHTKHKVLVELVDGNYSLGYTDNYIYTYIEGCLPVGSIVDIRLDNVYLNGMKGNIIS